jgi:hypothetical protein
VRAAGKPSPHNRGRATQPTAQPLRLPEASGRRRSHVTSAFIPQKHRRAAEHPLSCTVSVDHRASGPPRGNVPVDRKRLVSWRVDPSIGSKGLRQEFQAPNKRLSTQRPLSRTSCPPPIALYHGRLPYLSPLNWGIYYKAGRQGLDSRARGNELRVGSDLGRRCMRHIVLRG